ncbi:MAG TPA: hypothetical protein PKX21_02450 [Candidatus Pacearchaeota archaeon]|nr:hypothetical protein [Candidatus Pacearchaeota archaeon]
MTVQNFIKKRPYLVWSVQNYQNLSEEAIVEAVLNYGDFDDVKKLISLLGLKKTAEIFRKDSQRTRSNYRPNIKNYFDLYFKKYA